MLAVTELLRRDGRIFLKDAGEIALIAKMELLRNVRDAFV